MLHNHNQLEQQTCYLESGLKIARSPSQLNLSHCTYADLKVYQVTVGINLVGAGTDL